MGKKDAKEQTAKEFEAIEQDKTDAAEAEALKEERAASEAPAPPKVEDPDIMEPRPGVRIRKSKPSLDGRPLVFLGAHPSNTSGVKWTEVKEGQPALVWKKLTGEEDFPQEGEYASYTGFKDAAGRPRDCFLIRTISELQLWAVEL